MRSLGRLVVLCILANVGNAKPQWVGQIPIGKFVAKVSSCPVFYMTASADDEGKKQKSVKQQGLRLGNVDIMLTKFPYIKKMETLHWRRHWKDCHGIYQVLGLQIHFDLMEQTYSGATRGKLCYWSAMLLATAWQVRFKHKCMLIIQDDIQLPNNFTTAMRVDMPVHRPYVVKLGAWGEGFLFNFEAASRFLVLAFQDGIRGPVDRFVMNNFKTLDLGPSRRVPIRLLVQPSKGDMKASPKITEEELNYNKKPWYDALPILLGSFAAEDEVVELVRVAQRLTSRSLILPTTTHHHPPLSSLNDAAATSSTGRGDYPNDCPAGDKLTCESECEAASGQSPSPALGDNVPWRLSFLLSAVASFSWAFSEFFWSSGAVVTTEIISLATIQFTLKFLYIPCSFAYPLFVTAAHLLLSAFFGLALSFCLSAAGSGRCVVMPTAHTLFYMIMPMAIAFAVSTAMANTALSYCSISYMQMIGSTTSAFSAGMTVIMGGTRSRRLFMGTLVVAAAVSICAAMDISWLSTVLPFGAMATRALKGRLQHYMVSKATATYDPISLLIWSCLASAPLMFGLSLLTEDTLPWHTLVTSASPAQLYAALVISCMNAAGLILCSFIVTKEVGAVETHIVRLMTTVYAFIGGIIFFGEPATPLNIAGSLVLLHGAALHQRWNQMLDTKFVSDQQNRVQPETVGN